jgi:hypothetical protein
MQFTETTGIILGLLLMVSGLIGYLGGMKRNGILLAFQFIGEAVRDTQVDCALAELYHRGKATEKALDAARQTEAMSALYSRLNELEDSLTMVQTVSLIVL